MEYQALYRAFRPQTFSDVVGQRHVTQTLKNAIIRDKKSHAYLFSGPRGTGKTSIAKIFAKALNCLDGENGEPCNECMLCESITEGNANDVIEIDAASNNGVDEIRNIREKIKYAPTEATFKVYIIDEVHMLTTGAFNALLKTLEEPPSHAVFILATTEPHKLPATIISRCQRFDFKAIELDEIFERLKHVADSESISYEDDALQYISRTAEGGMRDALSILDQVIAYSGDTVTLDDAVMITGGIQSEQLNEWMRLIEESKSKEAFEMYHRLIDEGKDPTRLIHELVYFIRDAIIQKQSGQITEMTAFYSTDEEKLYDMINVLNDAMVMMRFSINTSVHLEVVIIKLIQVLHKEQVPIQNVDFSHIEKKIKALEEKLNGQMSEAPTKEKRPETRKRASFSKTEIERVLNNANRSDLDYLKKEWGNVLDYIANNNNFSLFSLIEYSQPAAASDTHVLIEFSDDFHCDIVNNDKEKRTELENQISSILDKQLKVVGISKEKWQEVRDEYRKKYVQSKKEKETEKKVSDVAREMFGDDMVETK